MRNAAARLATIALLALLVSSCRQVPPLPAEALVDLVSLERFQSTFNAEANRSRLVVLLSPT